MTAYQAAELREEARLQTQAMQRMETSMNRVADSVERQTQVQVRNQ
jgi:hypothetical protein